MLTKFILNKLKQAYIEKFILKYRKFAFLLLFITFPFGLIDSLLLSPADYQQGDAVRIMYVHVPAAWMALSVYFIIFILSISTLLWNNHISYYLAISAAPVGALFTLICLITGSIWGKPIWGTWWVWDARLTSVLILFFIYLGYIMLADHLEHTPYGIKSVSVLGIIGFINIPIIKFSVEFWNSLHQPASILKKGGIAIDGSMLRPLLIMYISYIIIFCIIWSFNIEKYFIEKKINKILQNS